MIHTVFRSAMPADADFDHPAWREVVEVPLAATWRGDVAPAALATTARLAWTPSDLWVGFECAYTELDVDADPDASRERHGLWERDVCEAFVQSSREASATSYKEFEVAPTGQWFDVAIRQPRLDVEWDWNSGLRAFAAIDPEAGVWRAVLAVPFAAFGGAPLDGERWRINLFRIARLDGVRQYLALSPTGTGAPDFHVPASFVPLEFKRG
jgi:hypothetical protein